MWRLFVRPNLCRQARAERGAGRSANSPDRLTYQRALFRTLVMDAYGVQRDQIGGPVWATADASDGGALFDVSAKVPEGATKEQVAAMLQNLLKERFKLSVHREQTQNAGYALVVAKGGSRLKDSAGPPEESERNQTIKGPVNLPLQKDGFPELFPGSNMGGTVNQGTVRIRFRDYPLFDLVQQLSFALAVRNIDRTGLTGKYDFLLEFTLPENGATVGAIATMPLRSGQTAPLNRNGPNEVQMDSVSVISCNGAAPRAQAGSLEDRPRYAGDRSRRENTDTELTGPADCGHSGCIGIDHGETQHVESTTDRYRKRQTVRSPP
jgi:uncharacterized protein (TIGR03435 family)